MNKWMTWEIDMRNYVLRFNDTKCYLVIYAAAKKWIKVEQFFYNSLNNVQKQKISCQH